MKYLIAILFVLFVPLGFATSVRCIADGSACPGPWHCKLECCSYDYSCDYNGNYCNCEWSLKPNGTKSYSKLKK